MSSSTPDEQHYMSRSEVVDELTLQKGLLQSLDDTDEDYEETKDLIYQEIAKLQARLEAFKQKKKPASSVPLRGPFARAAGSSKKSSASPDKSPYCQTPAPGAITPTYKPSSSGQPSMNSSSRHDYSSIDPFSDTLPTNNTPNNMDPFSDSNSAPAQAIMLSPSHNALPHRNVTGNMKRSIDASTGLDIKEESESKSRRTSPGGNVPTPTYKVDSNCFVDLCESDEEDIQESQRRVLERAEKVKQDREFALNMQNGYNGLPSSRPQPNPVSGNAFNRLMGGPPGSQSPAVFNNGSNQAPNSSSGRQASFGMPRVVQNLDSDDDDFQILPSKPTESTFRRPGGPLPGSYSSGFGQTSQNTGVAGAQRPSTLTPYTPSSYTTQAGMPYQSTQGPYSSQNLAQTNVFGAASQPSVFNDMQLSGSSLDDPMEIAERNNLSYGQRADLETYCMDPRRTQDEISKLLANITPETEIPKEDREGTPAGLRFTLYEHQKVALTWLKQAELGTNKGGILADDMGLGKTISTIALMLSRPSPNPRCRTTLIVAPVALLKQWEKEIAEKVLPSHRMSVFVYHSGKSRKYDDLRNYDVVLTSYGTLASEYKRLDDLHKRKIMHKDMDISSDVYQKKLPFLGIKSKWYRVVLDEAQNVKNKETKSAKAVQALQAETRFCLTGTPMMNSVAELYSLIKFLRILPYNDFGEFRAAFGLLTKGTGSDTRLKRAMMKLQALLRSILLRRTKTSTIDGKPLIELPEKTEEVIHAIFDEDQQAYYTSLETSTRISFNKFLKAGTVGKNYSSVLVLLLRLRQAACHPHLIMDLEQSNLPSANGGDMVALAQTLPPDVVRRLTASEIPFDCPVCYDPLLNPIFTLDCCHHVCSECLVKITSGLGGDEGAKAKCPSCRSEIDVNRCIDWNSYQEAHMGKKPSAVEVDEDSNSDSDSDSDSDTISDKDDGEDVDANGNLRDFIVDDDDVNDGFASRKVLSKKKKQEGATKRRPSIDDTDSDSETDDLDAQPKMEAKEEDSEDEKPGKKSDDPEDDYLPEFPLEFMKPKTEHPADDYMPETPMEAKARGMLPEKLERITQKVAAEADAKAIRKQVRREKRKAKGKEKTPREDEKAPHKHLNLATLKKEASKNAAGRKKYMRYLRKNFIHSAKTDKLLELLMDTPKDVKTIVFSQFTTLLDLCEVPIAQSGIEVGRYDGSMKADARHAAVESFQSGKTQVLLVSLKAGNAGLNLIAGSQVVILDPFWNPYVEMQAVDRAHRIGQQKPVVVQRILVKGTVEDRIIALQERKRKLVDSALDEKSGNAVSKLGIEELKYLFSSDGDVRETLVRAPQVPGLPDFGNIGAGGRLGPQYGAQYGAAPGLGSALNNGINAGLGALNSGAGLGSALGSAAMAVANPYLSGMGGGGTAGSNVYGAGAAGNGSAFRNPPNPYRDTGSSYSATSPEPEITPEWLAFGDNADRYGGNMSRYGDYGGYGGGGGY